MNENKTDAVVVFISRNFPLLSMLEIIW